MALETPVSPALSVLLIMTVRGNALGSQVLSGLPSLLLLLPLPFAPCAWPGGQVPVDLGLAVGHSL